MTDGRRPPLDAADRPDPPETRPSDADGDVRPALTPTQLAFLALIAAVILTTLRRLRRATR